MRNTIFGLLCHSAALMGLFLSTSAPAADFDTRCSQPAVILCEGFESVDAITGTYGDNHGVLPGEADPELDSTIRASGNSSVKFIIPSNSPANTSGEYFTNFSEDLSIQFDEGDTFFVQWRQRFSPEFLNTYYEGGGGWKQAIIGTGDQPGMLWASCEALTIVLQNTNQRGYPQMYNSCTGSASHGAYDPFEEAATVNGTFDFKMQNARPDPYCLYTQGLTNPPSFFPPDGNCFAYFPNEWMTFQVGVELGPRVGDEFQGSRIRLWVGREGQPSELVIDFGPYNLAAGAPEENQKYGKIWLLPYHTGKDPADVHPEGYTWYDDLIISTAQIPEPVGSTTPVPNPPEQLSAQ